MKKNVALIVFILIQLHAFGQATGEVDYPVLGIKFTIPEGWKGRELDEGYIMGSESEPGLIYLMTHEANTLDELKAEAEEGIDEGGGTQFKLSGPVEQIGHEGVGGHFTGTLEYEKAEAYLAAVVNPFGLGVTIMVITDPANFSPRQKDLAEKIANSFRFAYPKESPVVTEWQNALKGAKLTYLSSSGSSGYSGYSGSTSRTEILLCSNQQFSYYDSYSASFDSGAGFGSANNSDNGDGKWEVSGDGEERTYLLLHFNDGREFEFEIEEKDDKTYLSDSRYFRTYDHGECY